MGASGLVRVIEEQESAVGRNGGRRPRVAGAAIERVAELPSLADLVTGATDGINNAIFREGPIPATSGRPAIRVHGPADLRADASAGVTIESASPEAVAAVLVTAEGAHGYYELDLGHVAALETPASFRLFLAGARASWPGSLSFAGVGYSGEIGPAVEVPVEMSPDADPCRPPDVAGTWRVSGSYSIYMFEGCAFSEVEMELAQTGDVIGGVVRARPARAGRRLHGCRDVAVPAGRVSSGMLGPDGLVSFHWRFDEPGEPQWSFTGVVGATAMTGTIMRGASAGGWSAVR